MSSASRSEPALRAEPWLLLAAGCAWVALAAAGGHAGHGALEEPAPGVLAAVVAGWVAMVVAMMLPGSAPLLATFRTMVARRADAARLRAAVLSGYLATWTVVGLACVAGDLAVHAAVASWGWLDARAWLVPAAALALAGAYELSELKHRCLRACRTPRAFVATHWHAGGTRDALRLGVAHGVFCVGCCWALMAVAFALSAGSVLLMIPFAALMTLERTAPWAARLSVPVAAALLGGASVVVAWGLAT